MLPALLLLVVVAAVTVAGFVHHEWRATRTLAVPSGLRSAGAEAWIGGLTGLAWFVAIGLVLGLAPPANRPTGADAAMLLVATGGMAIYAVKLVPYALARRARPEAVRRAIAGLDAEAIELVVSAHHARYQPAVARTTLVAVVATPSGATRFPIAWAERAADRSFAASVDPELAGLAGGTGLPVRLVRDERALAPLLGAALPP